MFLNYKNEKPYSTTQKCSKLNPTLLHPPWSGKGREMFELLYEIIPKHFYFSYRGGEKILHKYLQIITSYFHKNELKFL